MSDLEYLYLAYTIIWAGTFLYLVNLYLSQKKMKKELDVLKEVLDGRTKGKEEDN